MTRSTRLRRTLAVVAALGLYWGAYQLMPRKPAGNMAYFIYSESEGKDSLCYYFFLPAYRVHQAVLRALGRPLLRHNEDRPGPSGVK